MVAQAEAKNGATQRMSLWAAKRRFSGPTVMVITAGVGALDVVSLGQFADVDEAVGGVAYSLSGGLRVRCCRSVRREMVVLGSRRNRLVRVVLDVAVVFFPAP